MKKIFIFFLTAIFSFSSCGKFKPDGLSGPDPGENPIKKGNLIVYSEDGWHSGLASFFVEKGRNNKLRVKSNSDSIKSATWKIAETNLNGLEVSFTPNVVREIQAEVLVIYENDVREKMNFKIVSVNSLEEVDPVKTFILSKSGSNYELLFLFRKDRLKSLDNLKFIGTITNWREEVIPASDYNYNIVNNRAEKVPNGEYVGLKFSFKLNYFGKVAIIHSGNLWADLSGSKFVKKEEPTVVSFKLESYAIVPVLN